MIEIIKYWMEKVNSHIYCTKKDAISFSSTLRFTGLGNSSTGKCSKISIFVLAWTSNSISINSSSALLYMGLDNTTQALDISTI